MKAWGCVRLYDGACDVQHVQVRAAVPGDGAGRRIGLLRTWQRLVDGSRRQQRAMGNESRRIELGYGHQ